MKTKTLLYFGFIAPLLFWLTTLLCGFMIEDYNHFTWLVSELGALGTKTQYIFTVGLVLSALVNLFFILGSLRLCKKRGLNTLPVLFLALYSFIAGPAIFPMPLPLHRIVGLPFPLLMLSPVLALFLWRKAAFFSSIKMAAILSFSIMVLGFLIYFPDVLPEYFGLKQRFLYTGWTIWSVCLSYTFLKPF